MPQLIIDNLIINYRILGSGTINLILLHGWGCDLCIFNKLIQKLSRNKYTVYALDFPGFGKSQKPLSNKIWGVEEYAQFVKKFVNKLQIDRAIIFGHSFGGRVGIKFSTLYPDTTQKLILVGCAGIKKKLNKSYLFLVKIGKIFFKLPFLNKYQNKILKKIGAKDLAENENKKEIFKKIINEDLRNDARKIKVPTLLIYGINDQETPIKYGQIFNKLIPNSKLEIIKNAGHYVFLDQEEKFLIKINNFLKQI